MGSISATFECLGERHTVLGCVHEVHQDGNTKGQPISKPYSDELLLTLLVTDQTLTLLHWAYEQQKVLPGRVIFHASDGQSPSVQLSFEQGVCVSYEEHFAANATGQRSFYCQLSIVARRFTLGDVVFDNPWPNPVS